MMKKSFSILMTTLLALIMLTLQGCITTTPQSTTIEVPLPLGSGVDAIIGLLLIVGAVIGYKRGIIVECITCFAVLVLLTICVTISKSVFNYLTSRSSVPDLFATILMTGFFIAGLILGVSRITFKVRVMMQSTILGQSARILGAVFGAIRIYFISAVFLVTLYKIDHYATFLPETAHSMLSRGSIEFVTSIFPYLKYDTPSHKPFPPPNE